MNSLINFIHPLLSTGQSLVWLKADDGLSMGVNTQQTGMGDQGFIRVYGNLRLTEHFGETIYTRPVVWEFGSLL